MKNEKNKKIMSKKVEEVVNSYVDEHSFKLDPNGSWTGRPIYKDEKPIQDADDL